MSMKILVVDDEKAIVDILRFNLEKEGFQVLTAYDGQQGIDIFREEEPDLILLDIMMPRMNGLDACKLIRNESSVPIIMLTARAEEVDKVLGLEFGADDYVTKPFGVRELMARVKSNIRRVAIDLDKTSKAQIIRHGNMVINTEKYEVRKDDQVVELTVREYELLKYLATQKEQIFTREQLLEQVWGYEYYGDVRTVDVTVRRLREKIEDVPARPEFVLTKRGVGYYFKG